MDDERRCVQCGDPLGSNRRPEAIFCRGQKCKRRYYRRQQESKYDPPSPGTSSVVTESRADARFRAAVASHEVASQPLTDYEKTLLQRQKRNPGPLIPELAKIQLDRALELQRREAEEYARLDPLKVEDPHDPGTRDHVARRAQQSRSRQSKPADPDVRALRPAPRPGPYPGDLPQVITGPSRNTPRWMM